MSIILKGIDLPKVGMLRIELYNDGTIYEDTGFEWIEHNKSAIQIPKGHGCIKDENEIIKLLEEKEKEPLYQHDTDDWWVGIIDAETVVNNSPTILEAET